MNIDKEFKALIPSLSKDEYAGLENKIKSEGFDSAKYGKIIVWNDTIIDGHNRYEICTKHNIKYETEQIEFESREDAIIWIIDTTLGRRNIDDLTKFELIKIKKRKLLEKKGKAKMKEGGELHKGNQYTKMEGLSIIDKPSKDKHNTREEIAKDLSWSTGKVAMADVVDKKANEETKQKIKAKEISINQVYQEIKKEEKKEKNNLKRESFEKEVNQDSEVFYEVFHGDCIDIISEQVKIENVDLVLTDPPYGMDFKSGWSNKDKIKNDKIKDTIKLLDKSFSLIKDCMKEDAHIYVFGNPNEIESIKPIFEKYFILKNILIWDRKVIGMGDLKTYGRSYDIIYFGYNKTWKDLNGVRDRDILSFERVSPDKLAHPTEKPIELLKYIIKKSSKEGDLVLDPFAGSCSTIKASKYLKRNSYGCEIEDKYIPITYKSLCQ